VFKYILQHVFRSVKSENGAGAESVKGFFAADFHGFGAHLFLIKAKNNAVFVFNPICGHLCVGKSKVKSISLTEHTEHAEEGGLESQKLFSHRVRRAHRERRVRKSKAYH